MPEDLRLTTWLAIGAFLYALTTHYLPFRIIIHFPLLLLLTRTLYTLLLTTELLPTPPSNTLWGRYTTRLPPSTASTNNPEVGKGTNGGVVMFVLGARINQQVLQPPYTYSKHEK
jgi:hypothetical protein